MRNLASNCSNLKHDGSRAAEQCRRDQQMLAELYDKYQLLRQEKGVVMCAYCNDDYCNLFFALTPGLVFRHEGYPSYSKFYSTRGSFKPADTSRPLDGLILTWT